MNRFKAAVLLLTTTFFWGVTFTIVKQAVESVDVFVFLAQRFILALLVILPIAMLRGKHLDAGAIWRGCVMGLFLFGAYVFQGRCLVRWYEINGHFYKSGLVPLRGGVQCQKRESSTRRNSKIRQSSWLQSRGISFPRLLEISELISVYCAGG